MGTEISFGFRRNVLGLWLAALSGYRGVETGTVGAGVLVGSTALADRVVLELVDRVAFTTHRAFEYGARGLTESAASGALGGIPWATGLLGRSFFAARVLVSTLLVFTIRHKWFISQKMQAPSGTTGGGGSPSTTCVSCIL